MTRLSADERRVLVAGLLDQRRTAGLPAEEVARASAHELAKYGGVLAVFPEPTHDAPGSHHAAHRPHALASADRNRFEATAQLVDILSHGQRVIVIDEAQRLNRECIEFLRHLHDHPMTTFALLLVGGDGCWEVLSREPMLRSRIYRRVVFRPLSRRLALAIPSTISPAAASVSWELEHHLELSRLPVFPLRARQWPSV